MQLIAMSDSNHHLNRLSVLHHRSLPMYLRYAVPWVRDASDEAGATLRSIAEDQQEYVDRFGELILESNGQLSMGEFPMVYTAYHDLSIDFLLPILIREQEAALPHIEESAEALRLHPLARAMAEEALGAAKGHLDTLRELGTATTS
ncbi:MAG TPA: hypothetical protein DCY79_10835 [Planctomycetaceae bacterium]|nr:hypothetical protein [Planctomycetaceae bacterium]